MDAAPVQFREWRCRGRRLPLTRPLVMGVVNVTPDSFADGGKWFDEDYAVAHALELAEEGADLLDIGGESTRPGASPVGEDEECRRVLPVIRRVTAACDVPLSVDTRHAAVARAAVAAGACIVNKVTPFAGDAEMAAVVRETGAGMVAMHMRGTPQTMAGLAVYGDVAGEVEEELRKALAFAAEQGILMEQMVIDPGIGFAKDTAQNLTLLSATERFARLAPVLVGVSRKRFIGELCGEPLASERLGGSIGAAVWCAMHGAAVVRVHDVKATLQALTVVHALMT
ncbi:MAG: dihydropteroate synthase [Kiritimatiellae bacterium]|nr:dihydropteroate synthase [Kiritimatiellia bacterium]NLG01544.1 dihydropteroate synthase [Lentisphaerota bacterium]